MKHYIYVLIDPRNYQVRYVGQTPRLDGRYKEHCRKHYKNNYRSHWLNNLHSLKIKPLMIVLEECDESNWEERETYWIKWYREDVCNLTNTTEGGEGVTGHVVSEETRMKISRANKGHIHTKEVRKRMSESHKGKIVSEITRQKLSDYNKGNTHFLGKKHTEESRKKISETKRGHICSQDTRNKIGDANRGRIVTDETKHKMREVHTNNPTMAKLSKDEVSYIKRMLLLGAAIADIANQYNVTRGTIRSIKRGDSWKNVK